MLLANCHSLVVLNHLLHPWHTKIYDCALPLLWQITVKEISNKSDKNTLTSKPVAGNPSENTKRTCINYIQYSIKLQSVIGYVRVDMLLITMLTLASHRGKQSDSIFDTYSPRKRPHKGDVPHINSGHKDVENISYSLHKSKSSCTSLRRCIYWLKYIN